MHSTVLSSQTLLVRDKPSHPVTHRIVLDLAAEDLVDTAEKELLGITQQIHWIAVIHDGSAGFSPKAM